MLIQIAVKSKTTSPGFLTFYPIVLFLLYILPLASCPLWGQSVQKKHLAPDGYGLWGEMHIDRISPDENWASFKISYQSGADTIFVRHLKHGNRYFHFAGGENSIFTKENFFICQTADQLQILNLETGQKQIISEVAQYGYIAATAQLLILRKKNAGTALEIRFPFSPAVREIPDVTEFLASPDGRYLAFSTFLNGQNSLCILDLKRIYTPKKITSCSNENFTGLTWHKSSNAFAFFKLADNPANNSLFYFTVKNEKLYELNSESQSGLASGSALVYDPFYKIVISDNLQNVFFTAQTLTSDTQTKQKSNVEIWNANDKWIYPQNLNYGNYEAALKINLWKPQNNAIKPITSVKLPKIMLMADYQNAILFNPMEYEPQFEDEGPSDFYIINLETLETQPFLKKQFGHQTTVIPSPTGKYIAYFKENNWWIYTISTKIHKNITAAMDVKFTAKTRTLAPESLCGSPGWNNGDSEILLNDQYDIWAVSVQGNYSRRLTRGRESKISFRVAKSFDTNGLSYLYDGINAASLDLNKDLILHARGEDEKTGYFLWNRLRGVKPIIYEDIFVDELKYNLNTKGILFRQQKYDLSPQVIYSSLSSETRIIHDSNPHQSKYFWGSSKLLRYQNSKGQNLKSALIYPASYEPGKKYPMVVNVYETQSNGLHIYNNPTLQNGAGFNSTILALEGYFVLLPDIVLEKGNPGISATDCVLAATKKVLEMGLVEQDKIGIIGHSFGGYEAAFIATQTSMFATAIASGGITDLNSFYFTVNQRSGKPDMWRFQSEQWNMGKTPYEDPISYYNNSPIMQAEKITAPVLLWTGKSDMQVDAHQSYEFYLALRRLGKKCIMMLYPNESHVLTDAANQKHITLKVLEWFDYFLKNNQDKKWITEGIN